MAGFDSTQVFSPYEVDQLAIKVVGDNAFTRDDCVGSLTVERETRTVTKKCRGVVKKRRTKPTGNGSITLSMHIKRDLYRKLNALTNDGLISGVYAFSNDKSLMPESTICARVKDEDDNVLYLGFPRCKIEEIDSTKITNGSDEVAEVEIKVSYLPDDYGVGEYEALADELPTEGEITAETWMTTFSSEAVQSDGTEG